MWAFKISRSLPNLLSGGRVLLVPALVWALLTHSFRLALILLIGACLSDWLDGFLARRWSVQTSLGAVLDPLADKLLVTSLFLTLGALGVFPVVLVGVVMGRDLLILGGLLALKLQQISPPLQPLWISKMNTTVQMLLLCGTVGSLSLQGVPQGTPWAPLFHGGCILTLITTFLSGGAYVRMGLRLFKEKSYL